MYCQGLSSVIHKKKGLALLQIWDRELCRNYHAPQLLQCARVSLGNSVACVDNARCSLISCSLYTETSGTSGCVQFSKLSYDENDKEKWKKVLQINFMSSEESEDEDVIEVHPIPWRSERVTTFLHSLDDKARDKKSPQARRQMKTRREGAPSSRPQPSHDANGRVINNSWMFTMCNN